jgi:hypothetical protein
MKSLLAGLAFSLLLAVPAPAAEATIGPKGQVLVNGKAVIPLGVWAQPAYLFEYWRHIGMNCIVVLDNEMGQFRDVPGRDATAGLDAAVANKLGVVATSDKGPLPADHAAIWGRLDGVMFPRGGDQFAGAYARAHKQDPNHFMMVNIPIHSILRGQGAEYYIAALKNTDAVISHVWPGCMDPNKPDLRNVGKFVDLVRKYSKDRPGGEVSIWPDINSHAWKLKAEEGGTAFPAPTQEELRFQIWLALIHGANGLCFFPISFDPFVYAQIPAKNEQELAWNSRLIERMTPALTADESTLKIEAVSDLKDGLLDWTTRASGGSHYVFLLNGQREAQTVTLRAPDLGAKWQLRDAVKDASIATANGEFSQKVPGLALRIWELRPGTAAEDAASQPAVR